MNNPTSPLRWEDLRVVLAIARAGSLSGAGRALRLSHATVFRRLGDIEKRLGVTLFERTRRGYAPTAAGDDLAATATRVEAEVNAAERRVAGRDLRLSGSMRVTTTDTLLTGLLSPLFAGFREAHPDIDLEVAVSNQLFNLSQRDADVAVRPSASPPEALVGRRVGRIALAVYAPSDATDPPELAEWIGPDPHMGYRDLERWMRRNGTAERCRYRVDSMLAMRDAVRDGAGFAVLPCYVADGAHSLRRIGDIIPELTIDLWLLTHRDLRRVARIRAFLNHLAEGIREREPALLGQH